LLGIDFYIWEDYSNDFDARGQTITPKNSIHFIIIQTLLRGFIEKEIYLVKLLGSLEVEPIYDEEFREYLYTSKTVDKALEKKGIDPYCELPCLNEKDCREFKSAKELAKFLKEEIAKYKPTKDSNELIEYIEFLRQNYRSFPFVNKTILRKKFKDDNERKKFLKDMIDEYVLYYSKI